MKNKKTENAQCKFQNANKKTENAQCKFPPLVTTLTGQLTAWRGHAEELTSLRQYFIRPPGRSDPLFQAPRHTKTLLREHLDRGVSRRREEEERGGEEKGITDIPCEGCQSCETMQESQLAQDIFGSTSSANAGTLTLHRYRDCQVPSDQGGRATCDSPVRVTPGNA